VDRSATIRSAATDDLPSLLALYRDLHPGDPELDASTTGTAWVQVLATVGLTVLMAELAATCTLPNLMHGARAHALIENVVTLASHRQQGLGRAILDAAQAMAFTAGYCKVMLATGSHQDRTLRFYKRAGSEHGPKTAFQARRP